MGPAQLDQKSADCSVVTVDGPTERFAASSVTSVFALAGFVGMVVALLPYRLSSAEAVPSAIRHYAEGQVESFAAEIDQGATGIVLLGDSRLLYGVRSDRSMATQLSAALGRDTTVMRLAGPGATFADYAAVGDAIIAAQPELVILQEDLLARLDTIAPEVSARNAILWNVAGGNLWNPTGNLLPLDQDWEACPDGALTGLTSDEALAAILASQEAAGLEYRSHGPHVEAVESFVDGLLAAGVDVVALSIPQAALAAQSIPRSSSVDVGVGIEALHVSVAIADDAYCDPAHLSPRGRDTFVDALVPAIVDRVGRS